MIWILLAGGAIALLRKTIRQRLAIFPRKVGFWLAFGLMLCAIELTIEFTYARGRVYPYLHELPVIKALHVNPRFGAAFIFSLSMLGAVIFSYWVKNWAKKRIWLVFLPTNLLIVFSLGAYLLLPLAIMQQDRYDITGLLRIDERIKQGETFPIERVGDVADDPMIFEQYTSSIQPHDTLFGYTFKTFQPTTVEGPAREIHDGAFNMTDPTGLVYPEANQSSLWSRIPQSERTELEDFLAHRQPQGWKLPLAQQIANWVSLAALLICLGLVATDIVRSFRSSPR